MRSALITRLLTGLLFLGTSPVSGQVLPASEPPGSGPDSVEPERLEQEAIAIRGNRALPKTLYIAPWKRLGSPLNGTAFESRGGERLEPVERDLFLRALELYRDGYSVEAPWQ